MSTLFLAHRIAQDGFTCQAQVQKNLPTPNTERTTYLSAPALSYLRGLRLLSEHTDEQETNRSSNSQSPSNWILRVSPAQFAWTTRQFFAWRKDSARASGTLQICTGRGRVLDFLQDLISNFIPLSSLGNRDLVSKTAACCENQKLSAGRSSKNPWHPSNIIFSTDFDCSCTVIDTCRILVRVAEVVALKRPDKGSLPLWQPGNYSRDYRAAIQRHVQRTRMAVQTLFLEQKEKRKTGKVCDEIYLAESEGKSLSHRHDDSQHKLSVAMKQDEGLVGKPSTAYREAELRMALTKMGMLEIICNEDVISLGVLRGPTREEIRTEAAARVRLRSHCSKFLQRLAHTGTAIRIVSANWSRDLIVAGLPKLPEHRLFVHSNDLIFDSNGRSLGMIDGKVVDAFDKEKILRALRCTSDCKTSCRNRQKSQSSKDVSGGKAEDRVLVYVGDSHTDLLGLLEADLGIVIGESLLMRRIIALFGIQLRPLAEASSRISAARVSNSKLSYRSSGILFESRGWSDIEACFFGDQKKTEVQL